MTITLRGPHIEISGRLSDFCDDLILWHADIRMWATDGPDDEEPTGTVSVGSITFVTGNDRNGDLADGLDSESGDLEVFDLILRKEEEIVEQFTGKLMEGVLLIDKTFVHPALRGHDISAWACAEIIHMTTLTSSDTLVASYPMPTEKRPGRKADGARRLAANAAKFGLKRIKAAPAFVGGTTDMNTMSKAREALASVTNLELNDLDGTLFGPPVPEPEGVLVEY
jgi:hypothetical protein